MRVTCGTWSLRSDRCFEHVRRALELAQRPGTLRVVHFSVQEDHVHLIVEADDRRSMSNGMRALLARISRGLNAIRGTTGRRFVDRYHEHVLTTPTEVRNAVHYVVGNRDVHRVRAGLPASGSADERSSLRVPMVNAPTSWLLRVGWQS